MTPVDRQESLASAVRARSRIAAIAVATILVGVTMAVTGNGLGAVPICVGLSLTGLVDRRLPLLAALALLPSLTIFHSLPIVRIAGSTLDFRLMLTGGVVAALGPWIALQWRRPDRTGLTLIGFLLLLVLLAPLNVVAPLKALPPIGRWAAYAAAYLAARRWLGTTGGFRMVVWAMVIGMLLPTLSGVLQLFAGSVEASTGFRITGVYQTSPVGLALAMQLPALALTAEVAGGSRPVRRLVWVEVALIILSSFVLVETATRLVFASFVISLCLIAILLRRPRAIPMILAGAGLVLVLQSDLLGRMSAVIPQPIPTPGASGEIPGESAIGGEVTISDPSLRFRLYIWETMLPSWAASPLVGHGTGSFGTIFQSSSGLARIAPHNDYVGLLVEAGLLGLVVYLFLQGSVVLRLLRRAIRSTGPARIIAATALVEFAAFDLLNAINNPTLFLDLQIAVWALVGSALGALDDLSDRPDRLAVAGVTAHSAHVGE